MRAVVGKGSSGGGWERDGEGWNGGGENDEKRQDGSYEVKKAASSK